MKKLLAMLLALSMLFVLSACGSDEPITNPNNTPETSATTETQESTDSTQDTTESTTGGDSTDGAEPPTMTPPPTTPPITTPPTTTTPITTLPTAEALHTHSYSSKVTTAATCGKDGVKTFTCSCGHSYTEKIAATGQHSYSKTVTNATCTAQGYTTYTCSCGHTYKDNYTNAKHSFNEYYVCSHCGIADGSNAYNYLVKMVKTRGKAYGNGISFDIYNNGEYFLTYNASSDYLYIHMSEMNGNDFCYSSIALDSYFYGITFGNVEVTGYLDAKNYTSNYPLSDVHYSGPSSDKYYYVEYARLSINVLMAVLNDITEQTEGLSMSDLGFKSYQ